MEQFLEPCLSYWAHWVLSEKIARFGRYAVCISEAASFYSKNSLGEYSQKNWKFEMAFAPPSPLMAHIGPLTAN